MKQGRMFIVLSLCLAAWGIEGIARAQSASDLSFGDVVEVNVVNVDVHVTDRNGKPVTDLRREDFEVFEDGKRVALSNFQPPVERKADAADTADAAETAPATGAAAPTASGGLDPEDLLHLIVYVDNFNLRPEHRARVLRQLRDVLQTLRPQDRVMLATNDLDLKVRLPFTSDPNAVAAALSAVENLPAQGAEADMERRNSIMRVLEIREAVREWDGPCSRQIVAPAESYALATRQEALRSIGVMTALVNSLSGVPGRKALLHVSNGIPVIPGEEVYQLLAEICSGGTTTGIEDVHDPALEGGEAQYNGREAALDAQRYSVARELSKLASHASSNRVILYTLQASRPSSGTSASADHAAMERLAQLPSLQFVQTTNLQGSLTLLASETGGRAILNAAEIRDDLRQMQSDLDTLYSLGYMPEHFGDGREHRVEVKVKRPGVQVRYRKNYRDKSSMERAFDRTLAALYHGYEDNPLDVALTVGRQLAATESPDRFLVPIKLRIPLFRLGIGTVGEAQSYSGRLKLLVSTRDGQGGVSPMRQVEVPLNIPREEILTAMGKFYEYELTLSLEKGEQHVAIAVRDEGTATTSFLSRTLSVGTAAGPDGAAAAR